jgi:hypothetical protein
VSIQKKLLKDGTGGPMTDKYHEEIIVDPARRLLSALEDVKISKVCTKLMGKCWHEQIEPFLCACGYTPGCGVDCEGCMTIHADLEDNFDPLNNKSDAYDLIQFVVNEWEELPHFLNAKPENGYYEEADDDTGIQECRHLSCHLLEDQRALPTTLAAYLKEGNEDN